MKLVAKVLDLPAIAKKYEEWESNIRKSFNNTFYNKETGSFGSQTANAMSLEFGLIPIGEESRILASLVDDIHDRDTHFSTGIMGIRFIFEVLTKYGYGELALALLHQNTYPSFGHLISLGATTLWEYWGEKQHDIAHGPRSLNHPMFGGYDNWFYIMLAGIRPDPLVPGFKHFYLKPHPIRGLEWVRCYFECSEGQIVSDWNMNDEKFEWTVVVPPNTSASLTLPFSHRVQELSEGKYHLVDEIKPL
jgi:alpha-L-rhamnosidase